MSRGRRKRGPDRARPLYSRALRLDYLQLGPFACFFLFEGMIALAVLLSMAGLVTWWTVLILPVVVAALVKINDAVASLFGRSKMGRRLSRARGVARVRDPSAELPTMAIRILAPAQVRRRVSNERWLGSTSTLRYSDLRQLGAGVLNTGQATERPSV